MAFPRLRVPSASRQMIDTFGGYNHNLRIGDGEFYNMKNMSSDDYPLLSTRKARGIYAVADKPTGLIAKDSLCYVDGSYFVFNGERYNMELLCDCNTCPYGANGDKSCSKYQEGKTVCEKQLISMGSYVIILPDKKYFNTENVAEGEEKKRKIEAEFVSTEPVTFSMCRVDGGEYSIDEISDTAPGGDEDPEDGTMWVDTSTSPNVLKQWSKSSGMWIQIASTYVKIASTGIGEAFELYDGITISGLAAKELHTDTGDVIADTSQLAALEGSAVVWDKGKDYLVVIGMMPDRWTITDEIRIERSWPKMDYVIECGNRLWGCRYGLAANSEVVNELYCSKLGDFRNWNCFMGISTDSWSAGVGTDGPFTGAIAHLGYPLFFKENHLHKVYISSNRTHQVADIACRGVQKGCSRSLAIVGETVYYKSKSGVCAYDGALPAEISYALGNEQYKNAVSGSFGNKYYISMQDAGGDYHLFVYDTAKGMWHREDNLRAECFCSCGDELYCIENGTGNIMTMLGSGEACDEIVEWMAETGMIGLSMPDMKYISRLNLRLMLPEHSQLSCYAEYDSSGYWEYLFTIAGQGTRAFALPVRPKRCDHMRLKLEGTGSMKLFSITKTMEQGSDVR